MQPSYTSGGWMWEHSSWSQPYHPQPPKSLWNGAEPTGPGWEDGKQKCIGERKVREVTPGCLGIKAARVLPPSHLVTEGRVGFLTRLPVPLPKEFPSANVKPDAPCALQLRVHVHSPAWQASSQEEGLEGRAETAGCWPSSRLPWRTPTCWHRMQPGAS